MTGTLGFSLIHRVGAAMSDFIELLGQKIGSTIEGVVDRVHRYSPVEVRQCNN